MVQKRKSNAHQFGKYPSVKGFVSNLSPFLPCAKENCRDLWGRKGFKWSITNSTQNPECLGSANCLQSSELKAPISPTILLCESRIPQEWNVVTVVPVFEFMHATSTHSSVFPAKICQTYTVCPLPCHVVVYSRCFLRRGKS